MIYVSIPLVPPDDLPPLASSADYARMVPGDPPAEIDTLLAQASAGIRNYCGWHVSPPISQTWELDGDGGYLLRLPTLNLVELLSVWNGGALLDPAVVEWSHDGYLRRPGHCWSAALRGVVVQAVHGYELAAVGDLTGLAVSMTARALASPTGGTQQTVGQVTVKLGSIDGQTTGSVGALAPYELAALDRYRLFGVP